MNKNKAKEIAQKYYRNGNPDFEGFYKYLGRMIPKEEIAPINMETGKVVENVAIAYPEIEVIEKEFKKLIFQKQDSEKGEKK